MTKDTKQKKNYDYIAVEGIAAKEIDSSNCITGDSNHLLPKLKESFKKATSIDIIVALNGIKGVISKMISKIVTQKCIIF